MHDQIEKLYTYYLQRVKQAVTLSTLDSLFLELFGKNGKMTSFTKQFLNLSKNELQKISPVFNKVKAELETAIEKQRKQVREKSYNQLVNEKADITEVQIKKRQGHLHLLTRFENEVAEIFNKLGFQRFDAPHIDTDYNNFEVLNIPEDHPARDLWDTLYIDSYNLGPQPNKLLLRTHTSNCQIHIMKAYKPPIRLMNIGRCFRYENLDARHEHTFEQFELVYIDKGLSMANLQYLSEFFLKNIFGKDLKARLKPKYYPFVEPGTGVDGECIFCKGQGCKICGETGWLELAGAGMIHPQVLKNGGIDPDKYSGIAWGAGPERMLMLKYGIEDIRLFKSGDLRFLERL